MAIVSGSLLTITADLYYTWKDLIKEHFDLLLSNGQRRKNNCVLEFLPFQRFSISNEVDFRSTVMLRWVSQGHFCQKSQTFLSHMFFKRAAALKHDAPIFEYKWNITWQERKNLKFWKSVNWAITGPIIDFFKNSLSSIAFERAKKWKPNVCFHSRCFHVQGKITTEVSLDCEENEAKTLKRDDA